MICRDGGRSMTGRLRLKELIFVRKVGVGSFILLSAVES